MGAQAVSQPVPFVGPCRSKNRSDERHFQLYRCPHASRSSEHNLSIYGSAYMEGKREAHSKVVQMVLPKANEKAAVGAAAS
jgi:hypothetical protein